MSKSIDFRARAMEYWLVEGHSQRETAEIFNVQVHTLRDWRKLQEETGELECRALNRAPRKFDNERLLRYVEENPDATLEKIAEAFDGTISGAFSAIERNKITFKKKNLNTKNAAKKKGKRSMK
jgi:transposase